MHLSWTLCGLLALPFGLVSTPALSDDTILSHEGMCDASAAVAVGMDRFLAANDEDNVLRLYRTSAGGDALQEFPLDAWLAPDPEHPEADIEGAARLGERVFWITSHGRSKNGKPRPGRLRLFATRVTEAGGEVSVELSGKVHAGLLASLLELDSPEFSSLGLAEAAKLAPEQGGINIEGLAAGPSGSLLIGFRSPVPGGKALVVPLLNPDAVVDREESARFGSPILLDLGGLGVRSLELSPESRSYWLVAGSAADGGEFRLYRWTRAATTEELDPARALSFGNDRSPEALLLRPGSGELVVLLDEGDRKVGQEACKEAPAADRGFSSVRFPPPSP